MALSVIDGKQVQVCDGCNQPLVEENTDPQSRQGYVSPDSTEYRETTVGGVPGKENIARNVCKNCYRLDFKKVYPDQDCPI